uniref:Uncharacterized protein n=1 Tax=Plectus sambesii TaxID=2011161 RepID=A0A914W913_9BILA
MFMGVYSEHSPEASGGSGGVAAAALKTEQKGATSSWYGADGSARAPRPSASLAALTSAPAAVQLTNLFLVSYISPLLRSSRLVCRPGVDCGRLERPRQQCRPPGLCSSRVQSSLSVARAKGVLLLLLVVYDRCRDP